MPLLFLRQYKIKNYTNFPRQFMFRRAFVFFPLLFTFEYIIVFKNISNTSGHRHEHVGYLSRLLTFYLLNFRTMEHILFLEQIYFPDLEKKVRDDKQ